jgi:hypothetical protein
MAEHKAPTAYTWASRIGHAAKAIITFVGGLAIFLTQVPDLTPFIPAPDRPYVSGALVFITAFATWYKSNSALVEKLPE